MNFNCFVCGKDNPIGLKLDIKQESDCAYAEFFLPEAYAGYPGILHGGILAAILDDVMANTKFMQGYVLYTVEINVKYLKHCLVNEPLIAYGYPTEERRNIQFTVGEIKDKNGTLRVKATGKYFIKGVYK
jgi:uncharacterized protein (TIGR00369 family)